jgi:hypothetical protein
MVETAGPVDSLFRAVGPVKGGAASPFHTLLDIPAALYHPATADLDAYLWPRFSASGAGEIDFFLCMRPYSTWGWETVSLTSNEAMKLIEPYLFNDTFVPSGADGYDNEIALVKRDIYNRIILADVAPDLVLSDGAGIGRPSGIGPFCVPDLILPATYGAIAHAFRKLAFSGEGFDSLAKDYSRRHDQAMDAVMQLLSVRQGNDEKLAADSVR